METMKSDHIVADNWRILGRHIPLLVTIFASLIIIIAETFFEKKLQKWGFGMTSGDLEIDECLPNFFEVLLLNQANEAILEYLNIKHNYGIEIEDPEVIHRLKHCKLPTQSIIGSPWYNILANPDYQDKFCYLGAYIEDREILIEDGDDEGDNNSEQSDLVMLLLSLSSIPDEVA